MSDINECNDGSNLCDVLSTTCGNDPGAYHCDCLPGFYNSGDNMSCSGNYNEASCCFIYLLRYRDRKFDKKFPDTMFTFVE